MTLNICHSWMKHSCEQVSQMFLFLLCFSHGEVKNCTGGELRKNVLTLRLVHQTLSPSPHSRQPCNSGRPHPLSVVVGVAAPPALTGQQCRSSSPPFLPIPRKKVCFSSGTDISIFNLEK